MENRKFIYKIKSKYIIMHILNYIKDKYLQNKIFLYSKSLQNRLEIKFTNIEQKYLEKIGFNIDEYLYSEKYENIFNGEYDKFLLDNNLMKDEFENLIYDVKNEENKFIIEEEYETKINIYSTLLDALSKTKNFENNYTICISQDDIDSYNLKEEYQNIFNRLNKLKRKYSSVYYTFQDIGKINYLKELNINFNNIKRLTLIFPAIIYDDTYSLQTLFSINNIENNLIYLKINCKFNVIKNLDLFQKINNFKSLQYLFISSFQFQKRFYIKLNTLKLLSCIDCKKIKLKNDFKELKELNLENNDLYNIKMLQNIKFNNLEKLNLSMNHILDINVFENDDFRKLKELNLENNKISDINILEKVKFDKLEILNLSWNLIYDINILEKVNFKELKELNLFNNNISDINVLKNVKFEKLEILNIGMNQIPYINISENVKFKELKELNLELNNIRNISILKKIKFEKLEILNLSNNKISDISVLENVNFKELKNLSLHHNNISDIKILEKVIFNKLEILDLNCNNISNINILKNLNFNNKRTHIFYKN